jgi:NTP pyrophosphatase (non-canonical NTP hydrolase)
MPHEGLPPARFAPNRNESRVNYDDLTKPDPSAHRLRSKSLEEMADEIEQVNRANGWFDEDRSVVEGHMLLVTEVVEATEAFRKWGLSDATRYAKPAPVKPEGVGSEYADIFIRLLDQCKRDGIDLRAEYERKIAYNRTRGYRHGGKVL